MFDAQAIADGITRDWFAEQAWHAERRAEHAAEVAAEAARHRARRPLNPTVEELHDALRDLRADVWVPALADLELPRSRMICCPLPGHDDRTPSCRVYDRSFHCFGCGRGGDIFAFASELWEIPTRSRSFPELRERLADHLLGVTA